MTLALRVFELLTSSRARSQIRRHSGKSHIAGPFPRSHALSYGGIHRECVLSEVVDHARGSNRAEMHGTRTFEADIP